MALSKLFGACAVAIVGTWLVLTSPASADSFVNFESGQVRPLAFVHNAKVFNIPALDLLFAVNTPDNRLTICTVTNPHVPPPAQVISSFTVPKIDCTIEVPVGLEPVAVAARTVFPSGDPHSVFLGYYVEAWVVNHLSDSVSIVHVDPLRPKEAYVVRTILLCDEPRDVVFGGSKGNRVFITAARRGQSATAAAAMAQPPITNCPLPAELGTAGLGRAVVQVFDADTPGPADALTGSPLSTIELFGDTPRALAVDPSGKTVFAAVFRSGNQSTTLPAGVVTVPFVGALVPQTGLVVKERNGKWTANCSDPFCTNDWSSAVPFELPDYDVFAIDADGAPPDVIKDQRYSGVGTVLSNMIVGPGNWFWCFFSTPFNLLSSRPCTKVYVSNTDARNDTRSEPAVKGHISDSRISILDVKSGSVAPVFINRTNQTSPEQRLAFPMGMALSSAGFAWRGKDPRQIPFDRFFRRQGRLLYVAGFGSDKIGISDADNLSAFDLVDISKGPNGSTSHIGKGPTGLALDESRNCLYVMNRFDNSISTVCPANDSATAQVRVATWLPDPSPQEILDGRHFLYDARHTSAHGDAACASCHMFGDTDGLAWDLGDVNGKDVSNVNPFIDDAVCSKADGTSTGTRCQADSDCAATGTVCRSSRISFCNNDPLQGVCAQALDCTQAPGTCVTAWPRFCNSNATQSCAVDSDCGPLPNAKCVDRRKFSAAKGPMTTQSLFGLKDAGPMHWRGDRFNPQDPLDAAGGFKQFNHAFVSLLGRTDELHTDEMESFTKFVLTLRYPPNPIRNLDSSLSTGAQNGNNQFLNSKLDVGQLTCDFCHKLDPTNGHFGTAGLSTFEGESQEFKVPHLRNMYQKIGMHTEPPDVTSGSIVKHDAVRGFGFLHDGSVPSVFNFLQSPAFSFSAGPVGDDQRRQVEAFLLQFDTGLAPIVGQQVTVPSVTPVPQPILDRIALLTQRARVGECDLVAKGMLNGQRRGWRYDSSLPDGVSVKNFRGDANDLTDEDTLNTQAKISGQQVTYTCVPPGSGTRIGIDRDDDGTPDQVDVQSPDPQTDEKR